MTADELGRALEAVLLVAVEPVPPGLLAELLEEPAERVEAACDLLAAHYQADGRGFVLAKIAGATDSRPTPISPLMSSASPTGRCPTACRRPPSRPRHRGLPPACVPSQICALRGVNVDGVVRLLDQRGYIEAVGRAEGRVNRSSTGRPNCSWSASARPARPATPVEDFLPGPDTLGDLEMGLRGVPVSRPTSTERAQMAPAVHGSAEDAAHTRLQKVLAPRRLRQPSSLRRPDRRRTGDRRRGDRRPRPAHRPEVAVVAVDGPRGSAPGLVHYALNKPAGVVTTASDPRVAPAVLELAPPSPGLRRGPIGPRHRGAAAPHERRRPGPGSHHPSHGWTRSTSPRWRRARPRCTPGAPPGRGARRRAHRTRHGGCGLTGVLRIVIHEGRNRQVRRMCETVGHPVRRLVRTRIGPFSDRSLRPGQFRSSPRPRCARSGSPPPVGSSRRGGPSAARRPAVAFPLDAPQASVRALRGATTVDEDTPAQIAERVQELLRAVMSANDLLEDDVISILFTATADVTSTFPPPGHGDRLRRGPAPVRGRDRRPRCDAPVLAGPAPCRDHPRPGRAAPRVPPRRPRAPR